MRGRFVYRNWVYGTRRQGAFGYCRETGLQVEIRARVRDAVMRLSRLEQEFVQLFWFEGRRLVEISELLGIRPHNLDGFNRRILKKLKRMLSGYVRERFGINEPIGRNCVICSHPRRHEIDAVLLTKKPEETCSRVSRELKRRFGLTALTPQTIIGHIKYHIGTESDHER